MNKVKELDYKSECIFYLGIEIMKALLLEEQPMYIDVYYNTIKEIYEDYKKYDNKNKSLLDSVHDYINKNEQKILKQVSKAFEL